jgi:hypothetical protein
MDTLETYQRAPEEGKKIGKRKRGASSLSVPNSTEDAYRCARCQAPELEGIVESQNQQEDSRN